MNIIDKEGSILDHIYSSQDRFLEEYPMLEIFRNSKTNKLYRQLGIS